MSTQLTLFPNASLAGNYPLVRMIKVPFEWRTVEYLMSIQSGDFGADGLSREFNREMKRADIGYGRLRDSIRTEGFMDPVFVEPPAPWHPDPTREKLRNGHHRVIAAYDLGFTHVPVTWEEEDGWLQSGVTS